MRKGSKSGRQVGALIALFHPEGCQEPDSNLLDKNRKYE